MEPSHAVRDSPKRGGEIAVVCLELDLTHFPPPLPSPLSVLPSSCTPIKVEQRGGTGRDCLLASVQLHAPEGAEQGRTLLNKSSGDLWHI